MTWVLGGFRTELSPPPFFVERGLTWDPPDDAATSHVLGALAALGVSFGACHTEFTAAGLIEVNAATARTVRGGFLPPDLTPLLAAFFRHGVVLEPHLQNVLIAVDEDDWPAAVVFRDLEGVKLVTPRHEPLLAGLPAGVARGLRYDEARGWDRVAYCLLVKLAGVPLPAKANLRVRWARAADRDAGYVPVPNPLRTADRAPWPVLT